MIFIKNSKNNIVFILVVISGLVIGSFLGDISKNISYLSFLNYGKTIGLSSPVVLDLEMINITFSFSIKFTIAGIIGVLSSILLYRKLF